jgi:hypothetical protein
VLQRNGRQGISVGVAPRYTKPEKRYEAGKSGDVMEVTCVWGDIDFKSVKGGAIDVCRRIDDLPLKPTIVVNSGYGRHVYYAFNTVLQVKDLRAWDEAIRALRDTLQGDATVGLARRMRLPGTLNVKEATPALCHICDDESSWLRYGLDEVREALGKARRKKGLRLVPHPDANLQPDPPPSKTSGRGNISGAGASPNRSWKPSSRAHGR